MTAADRRVLLNKVPEITLWFWIIKIMATTIGESAADYLNSTVGLGLGKTTAIMASIFLVLLAAQMLATKYIPLLYWINIVLISVVGTLITDNLTDNAGVKLWITLIIWAVALAGECARIVNHRLCDLFLTTCLHALAAALHAQPRSQAGMRARRLCPSTASTPADAKHGTG